MELSDSRTQRTSVIGVCQEEVIWNLVEDTMKLSEEAKKEIEQARLDIKAGKFYTHEQVKKRLGL